MKQHASSQKLDRGGTLYAEKIIMPSAGQTTDTATVTRICVSVGDKIGRGHILAEVETDKATLPIESFADGYICAVYVKEFDVIDSGTPLFAIGNEKDHANASALSVKSTDTTTEAASDVEEDDFTPVIKSSKTSESRSTSATVKEHTLTTTALAGAAPAMPGAKKIAAELGINLSSVTPENGSFIKAEDVRKAATAQVSAPVKVDDAAPAKVSAPASRSAEGEYEDIKFTGRGICRG